MLWLDVIIFILKVALIYHKTGILLVSKKSNLPPNQTSAKRSIQHHQIIIIIMFIHLLIIKLNKRPIKNNNKLNKNKDDSNSNNGKSTAKINYYSWCCWLRIESRRKKIHEFNNYKLYQELFFLYFSKYK